MGVPVEFRVELLQTAYGDTFGAICYSFAGGESTEIESFDEMLTGEAADAEQSGEGFTMPRSNRVISELFDTDRKSWHAIVGKSEVIADFYAREFNTSFPDRITQIAAFVKKQRLGQFDADLGEWIFEGFKIVLPTNADLGTGTWKKRSPTCLVNGDLHGGNVLINSRGTVNMIDFANVSLGPRFVDSTALAATIRMRLTKELKVGDYSKIFLAEQAILDGGASPATQERFAQAYPWFGLARSLNDLALANAARRHKDQAVEKELTMTQLCYALSIFGLPWLNKAQRLHLLFWTAALKNQMIGALG